MHSPGKSLPAPEQAPCPPPGPRERLLLSGSESLSDGDLMAILLGTGAAGEPVERVAGRLLSGAGGLQRLARLGARQLQQEPGIGASKACRIRAAVELGRRLSTRPLHPEQPIRSSRDVEQALGPALHDAEKEHFVALALDVKNRPLARLTVAVGGLTACALTPADAFRPVLAEAAPAVIFVHNHPSGSPSPSDEDVAMTRRLRAAGALLGVRMLDHVILARGGYFSFLDAGFLAPEALEGAGLTGGSA